MPRSCGGVGCSNNRVKTPSLSFFKLPSVIKTDQESEDLLLERRRLCLAKINRKDLTEHQLAEKNSALLHFRTPPFLLMILVQNFMLIKNHIETWV